jgi:predicted nucleic acid-binding protein
MKVLLDTNIIIHRETPKVVNTDIGILFNWLDKLNYKKYIHPLTIEELNRNKDPKTVETFSIKIQSYNQIINLAPESEILKKVSLQIDTTENDKNDTKLLNEVLCERVEMLISEDKKIHKKAELLGIADRVFKIDQFLEIVVANNPTLVDYKVLAVKKEYFAKVDLQNSFFDSFREDYPGFDKWFNKKADEISYICYSNNNLSAFLYIKPEDENENYSDIEPIFKPKKRLKIGTFKVTSNGFKIGERFLKIIFDNALQLKVDEIYVTIFEKNPEQIRLISLLEEWGFEKTGVKKTTGEMVLLKNFDKNQAINLTDPKKSFPYISQKAKVYIVPIYPEYHTDLFPDSILRNESPMNFIENKPHRNALSKVYISRSRFKALNLGDIIVFYMTGGKHKGVVTTVGIVESVITNIPNLTTFISLCKKRSVFSDEELKKHWDYYPNLKPFVVKFIYSYTFRKRPNLKWLIENGIIADIKSVPRGFQEITRDNFHKIAQYSIGK